MLCKEERAVLKWTLIMNNNVSNHEDFLITQGEMKKNILTTETRTATVELSVNLNFSREKFSYIFLNFNSTEYFI
jgi:hypothetical protein